MRSPCDLVELPYSFAQLQLLMGHQFISQACERGVYLSDEQLEALHRARLLVPLLRVRRDGRQIAALVRQRHVLARQVAHWHPTTRRDLVEARAAGRLHDPAEEGFISRSRRRRHNADVTYYSSEYLYSPHQVLMLPTVKPAIPFLSRTRTGFGKEIDPHWVAAAKTRAREVREIVVALSALEPVYHPEVTRRLHIADLEGYEAWMRRLRPLAMLNWLRIEPGWLERAAAALLRRADDIDPLGAWHQLLRETDPEQLYLLKHDARSAVDLRIAAEVLLRYYERLVRARRARPLPRPAPRLHGPFDSRIKPHGGLDGILTRFGLSPHPSLVLVVEGDTEQLLLPRLMEKFEIRTDPDYIAIENMAGVGRDISPLLAYLAPRTEPDEHGRYLRPSRPLTRILVVTDAEGPLATAAARRQRRLRWIDRIVQTLPKEHRTDAVRDSLEQLVFTRTWTASGASFEFAHFTDRQLAAAIDSLDRRPEKPAPDELAARLASVRRNGGSLDPLMPGISKVDLADALWPVLEAKIDRATARSTETRIPVVRVLDEATSLARELPRQGVVIPLRDAR